MANTNPCHNKLLLCSLIVLIFSHAIIASSADYQSSGTSTPTGNLTSTNPSFTPVAPGAVTVVEIGKTHAIIEWIDGTNNGRPVLSYNILGRTNWNQTWVTQVYEHEADGYTGRHRSKIFGLTPWTAYEFSVCAVYDLGICQQSVPTPIYNTPEDPPYIAPRNVGGGGGKLNELTIKWDPLLPHEQNALGIHYKIYYRLKGQKEWDPDNRKYQGNAGIAIISLPMDKYLYYTEFDVKLQAINNVGQGPESNITTVYSAEDEPQIAPQYVLARSYNSTALNITWHPIEITREKLRGKLIGYKLKYWKHKTAENSAEYYLTNSTKNWALLVGLEPDTYYFVKVMVCNAAGDGYESERYLERTYRKAPQKPPPSVVVSAINSSTVKVVWRFTPGSRDEEEPLQGYKIRVWEVDQDTRNLVNYGNDTIVKIGNNLEAYINDLTPGNTYELRVLAYNNGGDGRMSIPTNRFQMNKI